MSDVWGCIDSTELCLANMQVVGILKMQKLKINGNKDRNFGFGFAPTFA